MSSLYLPTRRLVQPFGPVEPAWENPLTDGLVFLHSASSFGINLVDRRRPVLLSGAAAADTSIHGKSVVLTSASLEWEIPPSPLTTTLLSLSDGYSAASSPRLGTFSVGATADGNFIAYETGALRAFSIAGGSFNNAAFTTAELVSGRACIAAVYNGSTSRKIFLDGIERASNAGSGTGINNTRATFSYRNGNTPSLETFTKKHSIAAIWYRSFSPSDLLEINRNPAQLFRAYQRRIWIDMGAASGAANHNLSASAQAEAAATAALFVSKPLAASSAAQAAATAALLNGVSLTAAGLAVASSSASMSHTVPLQASAAAVAVAGAQLALAVSLSAAGLATALASASLSTSSGAELAANGQAQASSSAVLSLMVSLSAVAVAQALASATLAEGKTLAANALAQSGGTAALQVGNGADLSAAGTAQASAGVNLNLTVPLSAAALTRAAATGSLLLTVPLTAAAFAQASGSAQFAGDVQMSAQGEALATATAALQVTAPFARAPEGSRFYQSPPSLRPARTQAGGRPSSSSTSRPPR